MLEGEIEQTDKLLNRLTERSNRLKAARKRVKEYLSCAIQNAGCEEIKGNYANITFRTSEETIIDDEDMLSEEFIRVKVAPNKTAIKNAIKQGIEVRGAHIEKKKNLQIK